MANEWFSLLPTAKPVGNVAEDYTKGAEARSVIGQRNLSSMKDAVDIAEKVSYHKNLVDAIKTRAVTDKDGNPVLDKDGNPTVEGYIDHDSLLAAIKKHPLAAQKTMEAYKNTIRPTSQAVSTSRATADQIRPDGSVDVEAGIRGIGQDREFGSERLGNLQGNLKTGAALPFEMALNFEKQKVLGMTPTTGLMADGDNKARQISQPSGLGINMTPGAVATVGGQSVPDRAPVADGQPTQGSASGVVGSNAKMPEIKYPEVNIDNIKALSGPASSVKMNRAFKEGLDLLRTYAGIPKFNNNNPAGVKAALEAFNKQNIDAARASIFEGADKYFGDTQKLGYAVNDIASKALDKLFHSGTGISANLITQKEGLNNIGTFSSREAARIKYAKELAVDPNKLGGEGTPEAAQLGKDLTDAQNKYVNLRRMSDDLGKSLARQNFKLTIKQQADIVAAQRLINGLAGRASDNSDAASLKELGITPELFKAVAEHNVQDIAQYLRTSDKDVGKAVAGAPDRIWSGVSQSKFSQVYGDESAPLDSLKAHLDRKARGWAKLPPGSTDTPKVRRVATLKDLK